IHTDTGSFRYSNVTARTFRTAAALVAAGAEPALVSESLYERRAPDALRWLGESLARVEVSDAGGVAWLRPPAGRGAAAGGGGAGGACRGAAGRPAMSGISVDAGVLVVDKAPGVTSFDAVTLVRRRLGLRRVGHAGTLDPAATGVLPILLGEATKLTPYLMDQEKEYVATVRFGLTTDTQDVGGRVLSETPVPSLARRELEDACRPFVGRIKQVPPMYSA